MADEFDDSWSASNARPGGIIRVRDLATVSGVGFAQMSSVSGGVGFAWPQEIRHPNTGEILKEGEFYAEVKDHRGRLHSVNGAPGKKYSDGAEEFYWHGVKVPELIARTPEKITVEMIEIEDNAEVRRVMVERYGLQRYMSDCRAVKIGADKAGELYKKLMGQHEEPLVFVKVKNSTAEPDGTFKDYFLRVPPTIKSAHDAVAWTFGLQGKDYRPSVES